jgi:pimeloyl-ACP methyl ester carboxylesterase
LRVQVAEHTIDLAGAPIFYRRAAAPSAPTLYLHGCPTSSDDWVELLQRTGGVAPDLVGFGRSAKAANLEYSLAGLANFIELFLDRLEIAEVALVAHDWGAGGGLVFAERHPERVRRLVLVDPLPLLGGFSWRGMARLWRWPGLGELTMGAVTRRSLQRALRQACVDPEALSSAWLEAVWKYFDQGTQRAILRLHRSAGEAQLEAAGADLERLTMPALVVWGAQDPWFPPAFAERYRGRLDDAEAWLVEDAGHWPWFERPEVAERIAEFVRNA